MNFLVNPVFVGRNRLTDTENKLTVTKEESGRRERLGRAQPRGARHSYRKYLWDFPGGPVVKTLPSNAGGRFLSLVGELRSHMPRSQKHKT